MYHHPNLVDLPPTDAVGPRRFEANAAQTYEQLVAGLVMLVGGAVAFWYWQRGELEGDLALLAFILPPSGLVLVGMQLRNLLAPVCVTLTPDGFEVGDEVCRWDDVAAVGEQRDPEAPLNGLRVWVRRTDGRTFHLSAARLGNLAGLLAIIHAQTLPRLAAAARAAVDRGEVVSFGPIEMDAAGLRTRGRVLAWDELVRVTPDEEGDLGVWAAGRRKAWLDVATGKVDNVRVLLQLVEEFAPHPASGR